MIVGRERAGQEALRVADRGRQNRMAGGEPGIEDDGPRRVVGRARRFLQLLDIRPDQTCSGPIRGGKSTVRTSR